MISTVMGSLRWCFSLVLKLCRAAFWQTFVIILLTLFSQISTLLASFLPLKVVILLGSEGVPRYVPDTLAVQGRDLLIVILSVATLGFFVLHLLAERLITVFTVGGTRRLLAQSHKMVLFERQEEIAASAYRRFSRVLAGGVFIGLALAGLFLLYPAMSLVLACYLVLVTSLLLIIGAYNTAFRESLIGELSKTITLLAGIGFFTAFAYLVVDFILFTPPSVLIGIVALLLSRQVLSRLAAMIQDVSALTAQRIKINALFFHGKVLLPVQRQVDKSVWSLLEASVRNDWLPAALKEFGVEYTDQGRIEWHASGIQNVAALRVIAASSGQNILVKLFDANKRSLAIHESTLMSEQLAELPNPDFLGATQVERFSCLVYEIPIGATLPSSSELRPHLSRLRYQLLAVEPSLGLIQRYQRSRPHLWQRLELGLLRPLYAPVVCEDEQQQVTLLLEQLPVVQGYLQSLPLAFVNPGMTSEAVWAPAEGSEPKLLNWERWALEPIGAKWPVGTGWNSSRDLLHELGPALESGAEKRKSLATVRVEVAELAALAAALEDRCLRQQFDQGLEIVPRILDRLDILAEKGLSRFASVFSS